MSLTVDANQAARSSLVEPSSNCATLLKVIAQVALQILIPFAAAYLSYLLLPASMIGIGVPTITVCTTFIVAFFSIGQKVFPFAQAPLPAFAPRGMENGSMNCWMNSLAQTLLCDEGLTSWFSHLPDEWERIERLPLLPPAFFDFFDSDSLENQDVFQNNENYLLHHPRLLACRQNENPDFANARSYYRDFYEEFEGTDDEFLGFIRAPEFFGNLFEKDRQKIEAYFQIVREAPESVPYFYFFAEVPLQQRAARKEAMVEFQNFLNAYHQAQNDNQAKVDFSSQRLRIALSNLNPMIDPNRNVQQDPMEALTSIGSFLAPRDLKISLDKRTTYEQGQNPPMRGGQVVTKCNERELACIQLSIQGSNPNLQDLYRSALDARNENPEALIRNRAVDGVEYQYLVEREEVLVESAPHALWLHVKRMATVNRHSGWECLQRLLPCLFARKGANHSEKLDTPIEVEQELSVQPENNDETQYQLDGFILHHGSSLHSGHYTSCRRVVNELGQFVWFEMNDRNVRELSEQEALQLAAQAYAYHYSKLV